MTWFADLTGFDEQAVDDVAAQFTIDEEEIVSRANASPHPVLWDF